MLTVLPTDLRTVRTGAVSKLVIGDIDNDCETLVLVAGVGTGGGSWYAILFSLFSGISTGPAEGGRCIMDDLSRDTPRDCDLADFMDKGVVSALSPNPGILPENI